MTDEGPAVLLPCSVPPRLERLHVRVKTLDAPSSTATPILEKKKKTHFRLDANDQVSLLYVVSL